MPISKAEAGRTSLKILNSPLPMALPSPASASPLESAAARLWVDARSAIPRMTYPGLPTCSISRGRDRGFAATPSTHFLLLTSSFPTGGELHECHAELSPVNQQNLGGMRVRAWCHEPSPQQSSAKKRRFVAPCAY